MESQEPTEEGSEMTTFGNTVWDGLPICSAARETLGQLFCVGHIPFNDGQAALIEADCFTKT